MDDRYLVGGPIAGRPWKTPADGLGLMIGAVEATCVGLLEQQS
jgi:hypothetical protein